MAQHQYLGELADDSFTFKEITWKIPNVLSLPKRVDYEVRSPMFSFANGGWALCMYPNGERSEESKGFIDFKAYRLLSLEMQQCVYVKFFIKTCNGREFEPWRDFYTFTPVNTSVGVNRYLEFSKLIAKKKLLAPGGTLTVVCRLRTKSTTAVVGTVSQEKAAGPVRSTDKLSCDLIEVLLSGENSDMTIKVKDTEFRLHRVIMGARTPVFSAMFSHDMMEKATGLVSINDCEPEVFRAFVRYVYSGRVDELSTNTVFGLFALADKYQVEELKTVCYEFAQRTLSEDSFCDVVKLALAYDKGELLEQATDFLAEKMVDILQTVNWMNFMKEHYIQANELLLKAAKKNKAKQ